MKQDDSLTLFNYVFNEPYAHLDIDTVINAYYKNFNKLEIKFIWKLYANDVKKTGKISSFENYCVMMIKKQIRLFNWKLPSNVWKKTNKIF